MNNPRLAREAFDNATYKQAADKIRQILSAIRNSPMSSAKRWVWELMQNAKDIPNRFGKVSIEIDLVSEKELQFRHNGDPFDIDNITGLIRQVSSKNSLNSDEETTGKFGTGFICTHLLSDIIDVEGVLYYNDAYRRFTLSLDRSGRSSEELIPRIREVEKSFYEPELYFEEILDYDLNRRECDYDTVFTYHLSSVEKLESAQAGLNDLINTLPITLVTQSKKIKQVHVIDRVNKTDVVYKCDSIDLDENVTLSHISINDEVKQYLSYITDDVALSIEIKQKEREYELVKRDNKQPVLYRDFPLIGSEKFYFPYTLNGFRLCPTEKRNSIPLNGEDNEDAKDNRAIIELAVRTAINFNNWLITHNAINRYLLAYTRKPEAEDSYDERIARPWIEELQTNWRRQLLEQDLVETNDGIEPLKNLSVPSFDVNSSKETNESFYNILNGFYFGRGFLPKSAHLHGWLYAMVPECEYESWGAKLRYDRFDFLKDLSDLDSIEKLAHKTGKSHQEIINWLNRVYKFFVGQNMLAEFDKYAIIPNQHGDFKLLKELYSDHSIRIPSILKVVYNSVNSDDNAIQHKLIDADIDATVFGNTIRPFTLKEMISALNEYVKSGTTIKKDGEEIDVRSTVAYSILSLYPNIEDETLLNRRRTIYNFCCAYMDMPKYSLVETTEADLWKESDKYWFENSWKKIASEITLANVAKNFFTTARTQEQALTWLDVYIKFYRDNSYGDYIKGQAVFPNQQLVLKKLVELRYDNNIPEPFKTLANVACYPNASKWCRKCHNCASFDVYRHQLLHNAIHGYEQHNPLSIKDIYEYVKKRFDESNDTSKEIISRQTISILVKSDNEPEEKKLYDFARTIYENSFTEPSYVENSTGFSWGFAQEFYITKIANYIASSVNITGLKGLVPSFKEKESIDVVKWIDDFIDFLYRFKNKKYWKVITDRDSGVGVWLNQKNDFCRFQDIREDTGIPEDLKDVACNRHVNRDVRIELFTLDSHCSTYLETPPMTTAEIGAFIDGKLKDYEGKMQDNDFRSLVFAVGKLCTKIIGLENDMEYFRESKNSLIVWSLGEGETMDLVGVIVQQDVEKIKAVKELLENSSLEEINSLKVNKENIESLSRKNQELESENSRLKEFIKALQSGGEAYVDSAEDEMSKKKMYAAQLEAQRKLIECRPDWEFPEHYGECDEDGKPYCYSTVYVEDENGQSLSIVLKSYKSRQEKFKINPEEWDWVVQNNAKLLVYTPVNGEMDIV